MIHLFENDLKGAFDPNIKWALLTGTIYGKRSTRY